MNKRQMKKRYMERKSDYRITLAVDRKNKKRIKIIKREVCKNPHAKTPVITSTLYGAYPSGCPKMCDWNYRE